MMNTKLPLTGVLIAEVGDRIAASACGSLLAQLGATVVVVEPPCSEGRLADSTKWRRRASALAGKLSLVCDVNNAADEQLYSQLLAVADVLVCSSDMQSRRNRHEENHAQVVCDITAFGHDGPLTGRGATEAQVQAIGGIVHTNGFEDGDPTPVKTPILEMSTGLYAAASVIAALRVRRLHGRGQRIDMALFDAALNALPNFLALHFVGEPAERSGNRHPLYAPWTSFRAIDGHVLMCSATADQFERICKLIGHTEMLLDERFMSFSGRRRHAALIEVAIEAWTARRTVHQCVEAFASLGVPCGPVIEAASLQKEPNLNHRGMFVRLDDPASDGVALVPSTPMRSEPLCAEAPSRIPAPNDDRQRVVEMLAARKPSRASEKQGRIDAALTGVRVVEIGHYTVAPLASRQLGALGADVIKVEPPSGDAIRNASSQRTDGMSHIFVMSNTDKRGLVLDLRQAKDCDRLHALLAQSDILVENLRQGALAARGFGREVLRARHPHLVYCAISGFGADSVYPGRPAYDTVIQAMSGLMATPSDGTDPLKTGISSSDMIGGQFGLVALLAGLEQRDRFGEAPHFDISMQDASAWITQYDWHGAQAGSTSRMIPCADGHVIADKRASQVVPDGSRWEGKRIELVAALEALNVRAAPVLTIPELVVHPQTCARKLLQRHTSPGGDEWVVIASPLRMCGTPPAVHRTMGRLGQDDAEVLAQFGLHAAGT